MKLLRYGSPGYERPGLLDHDGVIRDLSSIVEDITPAALTEEVLGRIAAADRDALPSVTGKPRLGPPIARPGAFLAIGLNYSDHAAEMGAAPPAEPILFMKGTHCIVGPNDDIRIPRGSQKTDWEVELGVVIGKPAKYVSEADALSHVAGYCTINDVSERAFQSEGTGQWVKGKACDTFGPIGPWLVTADEVPDPQNLNLWLDVDGARQQTGNTGRMIFGVAFLISYLSRMFTLHTGDIIATGTPPGVGNGQKPPKFLRAGNVVTLGIEGLGEQEAHVTAD
ncbi:MAG TPA: fumarylacetoacetate hydrolase family protein [Alphaproteobacteria bacterium]|jgi:2-keto-4-pentenoate hydratase/2-oxohepta-3-ene-1,7-dioic acid hydratase in catechol pathway|nr:fumarylacetoacetate hydrolase family protein [Alphaproteobacteria bacterium]